MPWILESRLVPVLCDLSVPKSSCWVPIEEGRMTREAEGMVFRSDALAALEETREKATSGATVEYE